uniref:hypothetical protein n=1 Tax=Agathobacter sp. TaxID=2021311 RepID=UPI004057BFCA
MGQAVQYLSAMFGLNGNKLVDNGVNLLSQFGIFILLGVIFAMPVKELKIIDKLEDKKIGSVVYVAGMLAVFFVSVLFVIQGGTAHLFTLISKRREYEKGKGNYSLCIDFSSLGVHFSANKLHYKQTTKRRVSFA